jgi:hypothetical protein
MSTGQEKRKVCVLCGAKRFQRHLQVFTFVYYASPVTKSMSYHFACKDKSPNLNDTCFEKMLKMEYNVHLMPYKLK